MKTFTQLLTFTTILLCLTATATAWDDGYGPISDGYFSVHLTGQDQFRVFQIHGDNQLTVTKRMLPCDETHWISTNSWLPYAVSCRGGANFCENKAFSYNDDWLAIMYSNQLVNVQTDTRCGHIDDSYFDHYRCIIRM